MKSLEFYKNGIRYPGIYNLEIFTESSNVIFKIFRKDILAP